MATSTLGSGTLVLAGTTSGTTTVTATAVAGTTTLTLPAATDTLVGKATTDTLTNKTLTGAAMNGTLGATTASTANVTTLTTSSTVTHNGGTINGVAYLDGSKVLTTGSALVFDGTNLGIGVSPAQTLHVKTSTATTPITLGVLSNSTTLPALSFNGAYASSTMAGTYSLTGSLYTTVPSGAAQYFAVADSIKVTIDSNGNLLVGTTSDSGKINCLSSADQHTIRAENTNATLASNIIYANATRNTTNGSFNAFAYYNTTAGSYKFYVIDSGAIYSTSIVITSISDQRLKENVRDIDTGLDSIMALKPRRFDWKEGKGQDKKNVAGFIAQEFEDVFPECVSTSKAGADGIEYKNINHETLIPTLVKAIQEQQATITTLTARISALEST
jgi:hypothetical protein